MEHYLTKRRAELNLSRADLVKKLRERGINIPEQTIAKWEGGAAAIDADIEVFEALAEALELDLEQLLLVITLPASTMSVLYLGRFILILGTPEQILETISTIFDAVSDLLLPLTRFRNTLRELSPSGLILVVGLLLSILGFSALIPGPFPYPFPRYLPFLRNLHQTLATTLIGLGFTAAGLEVITDLRDIQRYKKRLIGEMRSQVNDIAIQAVSELRATGWLFDGSLQKKRFGEAKLHKAPLGFADLRDANFYQADLREAIFYSVGIAHVLLSDGKMYPIRFFTLTKLNRANLRRTNLKGAKITNYQLRQSNGLLGATMPDGSRYGGRFHLEGDIELALRRGINVNDLGAMEAFYRGDWEQEATLGLNYDESRSRHRRRRNRHK